MAPICVGIQGLSKSSWATCAHLPYLQKSEKFEIVAVQNSSAESAREAIERFGLGSRVKAYGDPESLAKDPNVDLVVCSVRVDRHIANVSPSLRAGKNVYVEWPLGANLADAEELLKLKNDGVREATVGLQARQAPLVKKLKELVDGGIVGKVLSSTWQGQAGNGGPTATENLEYLGRKEVGGNLAMIHFGHAIDFVQQVLGYEFQSKPSTLLANRRPTVTLLSSDGTVISKSHPKTSDDTIFLHGTLSSSIPLSFTLRGGASFKGVPGLDWRIYGSTGEVRITASGPFLQIGYPDMKIEVHDFEKDEVKVVEVPKDEWDELPGPARNVARVYEEFAAGRMNCTFEDAVERHRFIEKMYIENGWDPSGGK